MKVRIKGPQSLHGKVKAPGSKAYTHRALLAALLSDGESVIQGSLQCDDTRRTLQGIKAMGARVNVERDRITAHGVRRPAASNRSIDCGESGATLRFLSAIGATSPTTVRLVASPRLASRPFDPLVNALKNLGAGIRTISDERGIEALIRGPLRGGEIWIRGDISSQFISGLLFAAPLADREVRINVEGPVESRPYVNMTIEVLKKHGISIKDSDGKFTVPAPQKYSPAAHSVPGDYSSAAFLIASTGTAGDKITITGLESSRLEPDSAILRVIPETGLDIHQEGDNLTISKSKLDGFEFDASNNPDLVPPLEALACFAKGSTEIRGVKRLIYKESDRLHSLPTELMKMGARIQIEDDIVKIQGIQELVGNTLDSHADHRVAMACAAASLAAKGESTINNSEVVSKSYPEFFQDLTRLGAQLRVE